MTSTPLIPRQTLFSNPDKAQVRLSPDGNFIAYLAPRDGVMNLWVAPRNNPAAAQPITHDSGRGIPHYLWAYTSQHLLYSQDTNGDENYRLYSVDTRNNEIKNLTPFENARAEPRYLSPKFPEEVIVALNNRDPEWHDLYRINIISAEMTLLEENNGYSEFILDDLFNLRLAYRPTADAGLEIFKRTDNATWEPYSIIPNEDTTNTQPIGFDKTGNLFYMKESRGRNTSAVVVQNLTTQETTLLAEDPRADAFDVICHPTEKHVQAVSFVYERKSWKILDPAIEPDLAYLASIADGEVEVISRSLNDKFWAVMYVVDNGAARYYIYDRSQRHANFLFTDRAALENLPLVKMHSVVIPSRDGLDLIAYYSLPAGSDSNEDGIPDGPLPMVFNPHGGPWWRDFWGYNEWHQWLTNRGYAVLTVNFRASTGIGKAFLNAGNKEWGGKVMEDQIDAVQWAIAQGIADPQKVAIMGGSFGGYSTLTGISMYPETFACGVDLVGMSNLITTLESIPPYWKPTIEIFAKRIGDHRTEEGRALLKAHSALTYVDQICHPLMIAQGANDPRVKKAESEQIVSAMQEKQIPVTYLLYPDEGHGFARPENNMSFYAIAEAFLAKSLGGRYEPIGDDFKGSSLQVITGAEDVPGLADALAAQ